MEAFAIILAIAFVIVVVVVLGRRFLHIRALKERGWSFQSKPRPDIIYGLNLPPFGIGMERSVRDYVYGKMGENSHFTAFKYSSSAWRSKGYVLTAKLPRSLPPVAVGANKGEALAVDCDDQEYARLIAKIRSAHLSPSYRLIIDHNKLVLIDVESDPDALESAVRSLDAARTAIIAATSEVPDGPTPPKQLSVYRHPNWLYQTGNNEALDRIRHTREGHGHWAGDVISGQEGPFKFLRLTHHWKTREKTTNAKGETEYEERDHEEELCVFQLTFPFKSMSLNFRKRNQSFESEAFNRMFRVHAQDPRFTSAVITPRMMEYLMAHGYESLDISGDGPVYLEGGGTWQVDAILSRLAFLNEFFARVPNHVYVDLGISEQPVPSPEVPGTAEPAMEPQPSQG